MWQAHVNEALELARRDRAAEERRRALRHPGALDEMLVYAAPRPRAEGPGRARRAAARLAAAVSARSAAIARSLDASPDAADRPATR